MILTANLFIKKKIKNEEDIRKYERDIASYIPYVDKLTIYNMTKEDLTSFYQYISKYNNIECTDCEDLGEVNNYKRAMLQAKALNADYTVILEQDYFYEEDVFLALKRMLLEWDGELPTILSPYPKYTCEMFSKSEVELRTVKGVRLVGTFINVEDYFLSDGFLDIYYETTFDYDYCITSRINGKKVYVANNLVLRNRNFKILTKKILTFEVSSYEKDPYQLYYETRNRFYLWEKFKNLDPEYILIDKKLFKGEVKEMNICDKMARYKRDIIEDARKDAMRGNMGKSEREIN
ncbi:MAG: hypothetical protein IJX78_02525 [Bacilli bacterium]|nr:hypothetical protein [Bacilli bacterium]